MIDSLSRVLRKSQEERRVICGGQFNFKYETEHPIVYRLTLRGVYHNLKPNASRYSTPANHERFKGR